MKIVWSKNSEFTLNEILNYIENKFGLLIVEKYYFDILETLNVIEQNPELFPVFKSNEQTRKSVINKKTILYYQIENDNINLLAFYDVRKGIHKL